MTVQRVSDERVIAALVHATPDADVGRIVAELIGDDVTKAEIINRWRIRRGRPMLHPTDREIGRALRKYDTELRAAQEHVEQVARAAREFELPVPCSISLVVGGFIVSAQP